MRPITRPGLRILRRDVRSWQAGLEWSGVATVIDTPAVHAVLDAVDGFRDLTGVAAAATATGLDADDVRGAIDALVDSGVIVDQRMHRPAGVDDGLWAAWWLLAGPERTAQDVARLRKRTRVAVIGDGLVADQLRTVLNDERVPAARGPADASVLALTFDHEPDRAAVDDAMRRALPFLCVSLRDLVGVVGPFVVPGRTACLRCVDLSRGERDPCWPTLLAAAEVQRGSTTALSPALAALTGAYAASEIALWASGYLPVSCDAVVEIPHGIGRIQTVGYPPHPACGCGWPDARETMTA